VEIKNIQILKSLLQLEREFEDDYCAELEVFERNIIIWEAQFKVLNKRLKELSQGKIRRKRQGT
jgi:hypothetical protein